MAEKFFKEKFEIIHFLDSVRWQKTSSYYLINFAYPNRQDASGLTEDEKLLTHWLSYITDRQMPFQQIWDKGGLIFSEIVHEYKKNNNIDHIIDFRNGMFRISSKDGYEFISKTSYLSLENSQKKRLEPYYTNDELKLAQQKDMQIVFKSRFYTDDYLCMLYTLNTLLDNKFGGSFTKYLALVIDKIYKSICSNDSEKNKYCVLGMAYALDRLTYSVDFKYGGKRVTYKKTTKKNLNIEDFVKNEQECFEKHKNAIINEIFEAEPIDFLHRLNKFFDIDNPKKKNQEKFVSMKRTWCSLRDYLKSPEYKTWFVSCIKEHLKETVDSQFLDELFSDENNSSNACQWLELPGDVWNENSVFRRCITRQTSGKLGAVLRTEHGNIDSNERVGYPEEFDTTFDFVPRMCEKNNCDICPFGAIRGEQMNKDKIEKLCVPESGKYCPMVLLYCGYYYECSGREDNCTLKKYLKYSDNE